MHVSIDYESSKRDRAETFAEFIFIMITFRVVLS